MNLSYMDWLNTSVIELERLNNIEHLIIDNKAILANQVLSNLDLDRLIRFTELSATIKDFCEQSEQQNIWRAHLESFHEGTFYLQEFPPLTASQLVKGIYFYWLAAENRQEASIKFGPNELEFLEKSANYHCFNAYNSLSTCFYDLSKTQFIGNSFLAIEYAKLASKFHWTAGYILLYKTYLNLAVTSKVSFYNDALESLLIARELSTHHNSKCAVNNAYFGQGPLKGNNLQVGSWEKAVSDIIDKGHLSIQLTNRIYDQAKNKVREILDEFPDNLGDNMFPESPTNC